MKRLRRSLALAAGSAGAPPATTRTGLPQGCASMQKKGGEAMAGVLGQPERRINRRARSCGRAGVLLYSASMTPAGLLGPDDPPPVEVCNPEGKANALLICDHAS